MGEFGLVIVGVVVGCAAAFYVLRFSSRETVAPGPSEADLLARAEAEAEMLARLELQRLLEVQNAHIQRLADGAALRDRQTEQLGQELAQASKQLQSIVVQTETREERERETAESIRRLMVVMAGGGSKGRAGENLLHEQMAHLSGGILDTDFVINGKTVEFALRLPDGRHLPVDAKWSADAELERLEASEDEDERKDLRKKIDAEVEKRAIEVAKYIDHTVTAPVAVAVVPDAAYAALKRAPGRAFDQGVIIVPMSSALPTVLFLYSLIQRYGDAGEARTRLSQVAATLKAMDDVLEKKFVKAATMIANGTNEFRSHLGRARAAAENGGSAISDPDLEIEDAGIDDDDDSGMLRLVP